MRESAKPPHLLTSGRGQLLSLTAANANCLNARRLVSHLRELSQCREMVKSQGKEQEDSGHSWRL